MPQIARVITRTLRIPLLRPVRNGTERITARDYFLLDVETEDGAVGHGYTLARGADLASFLTVAIGDRLIGQSLWATDAVWSSLVATLERHLGRNGAYLRALSALDVALWDLKARQAGLPVTELLGGRTDSPLTVTAAAGYYVDEPFDDIDVHAEAVRQEFARLAAEGYTRFKLMAGAAPLAVDRARLQAAREAAGADAEISVDVNGAWSSHRQALRFLNAVADVGIDFVEDPFLPDRVHALARLRRAWPGDIAVGEWESGGRAFRQLLESQLVDVLRLDVTTVGGVTEFMKACALAEAFDAPVLPHWYPELHAPLAAVTATAEGVEEIPVSTGANNIPELLDSAPLVTGGTVRPPARPGFGLSWSAGAISRYQVGRPTEISAAGARLLGAPAVDDAVVGSR